ASRAALSMMPRTMASNCTATSCNACWSPRRTLSRSAPASPRPTMSMTAGASIGSDDDQLRAEGTCLFQRFENRHEIARRRSDLVHRLHDLIERDPGVEHEHAVSLLLHFDLGSLHDGRLASCE